MRKNSPVVVAGDKVMLILSYDDRQGILSLLGEAECVGVYEIKLPFEEVFKAWVDQLCGREANMSVEEAKERYNGQGLMSKSLHCPKFVTETGRSLWGYQCNWSLIEDFERIASSMKRLDHSTLIITVQIDEGNPIVIKRLDADE